MTAPASRQSISSGPDPSVRVPPALTIAAAWGWRLLIVGGVLYLVLTFLAGLPVISVPIFLSLIFAALLHRPVYFLRRFLPNWLAALVVVIGALALVGAILTLVVIRVENNAGFLLAQSQQIISEARGFAYRLPGVGGGSASLLDKAQSWVDANSATLISGAYTAARLTAELITGLVLSFFLTLFFLIDGDQQWGWLVRLVPARARAQFNGAGRRAFSVLAGWIGGTTIIAVIHAVVIGVAMWLLGTPLVLVLVVLIFFGSFIPLVGAIVFGGLAALATLLTVGVWPAVILLAVLVIEDLLEAHVYQPLIMGRTVRLHPVVVVLALTVGGSLAGIIGALVAIPVAAAVAAAAKYVTGIEDIDGNSVGNTPYEPPAPPTVVRR